MEILNSITYLDAFHFSCISSALHEVPDQASICFFNVQKIDPSLLTSLFGHLSIRFFPNYTFLIFKASPSLLEKALFSATELDIAIPPTFITASQKLIFELIDSQLLVRLTEATQENLLELQITRQTIRVTTDVFFTAAFISFLKLRFLCQDSPQIQTVKNSSGDIPDVLAFTSTTLLFDTLPRNQLPFNFQFENFSCTLSYLETLFATKLKSMVIYLYETQQEHLQHFVDHKDSLASRIPLLLPHPDKGGPAADSFILSITTSSLPHSSPTISCLAPCSFPDFYIFLSPVYDEWTSLLAHIFPAQTLSFFHIPLSDLTMTIPVFCHLRSGFRTALSNPALSLSSNLLLQ